MRRFTVSLLAASVFFAGGCATTGPSQSELDDCNRARLSAEADLADAQDGLAFAERRLASYADLVARLRAAFGDQSLALFVRNGMLVLQLPNDILFDSGKASLKPEGESTLEKVASVIAGETERRFIVAGHTDSVPVAQKNAALKSNWQLSQMRALAATQHLIAHKVLPTQLSAAGYGEFMPVGDNATDDGKAKNRRIEIIFMPTLDEIPELRDDVLARR